MTGTPTGEDEHEFEQKDEEESEFERDEDGSQRRPQAPSEPLLSGVPLNEADHGEILRLLIGEGAEAAMDTFFEAKDPEIDPALKLKLVGLASHLGDNVRKAIATHATHFRGER